MSDFWNLVEVRGPDDCWPWKGNKNNYGYGRYKGGYAHRAAYELTYGPIPEGLEIHHPFCSRRDCVNPYHLWTGTRSDRKPRKRRPSLQALRNGANHD